MDIQKIRRDTIGCEQLIHLNNAGAALMPAVVANGIRDYISAEETGGGYETADKYSAELDQFYTYMAKLLHCRSENIAFTTNATDSFNRALSAVPFKQGDVILTTENDYPSNFIAFISLQKRLGIEIVTVRNTPSGETDLEDLEQKINTLQPRLVSVTHVPTSSGLVQPVAAIGNITKRYDTLYLLDACQSVGQLAVDAIATGADFISGTFRKFLRGPRGAGFLYISDKALQSGLEPLFPDLRGAEWTGIHAYTHREDAKRFEDWETAFALMAGSTAAIKYLLDIGIQEVQTRNETLTAYLRHQLGNVPGVQLQDKGKHPCSIVTFSIANQEPERFKQYFKQHGVNIYTTARSSAIIDFTQKGIEWVARVSPHYYNTEAEIDRFMQLLTAIA
ncbi:aminotransferase class V-fold PLP-dependent enzyme [Chitinophaga pinensis]|uniref:Aminotransferase class V n=1 Tax=Chitinophaga pinensis (strain ATCC 43595 / DSM 2588 / LMG 13176 / NBRC 15968 / NCIMB 11800 / UQM 2034) TaxID=485918 RepID=A0A979GYS0_CHIPD|nr:aminotransferase class V-fold PLP-dependent enzyme [Chitinophaga pinensis]ACU61985.1 aminotransferase class V [Chitinophaga pinensis DSM 2588]